MLLGPYPTQEAAILACGGCECQISVIVSGPCGLELSGGIVYSIGDQSLSVSAEDGCGCLTGVTVNGQSSSYVGEDGEPVTVEIEISDDCMLIGLEPPECIIPMFGVTQRSGSKVRMKLIPENVAKYLLFRRKRVGGAGK